MTCATVPVIIPVKALRHAKERLAGVLTADERRQLVVAMLKDVLETLAQIASIGPVLIVTPDSEIAEVAREFNAEVILERTAAGLNSAVRRGLTDGRVRTIGRALILPGDVPLARADELKGIADMAVSGKSPQLAIAPDQDGDGTNALLLTPPDIIEPDFGSGSFARHIAAAVARGADVQILRSTGLAIDIDVPRDLDRLLRERWWLARYEFLRTRLRPGSGSHSAVLEEGR